MHMQLLPAPSPTFSIRTERACPPAGALKSPISPDTRRASCSGPCPARKVFPGTSLLFLLYPGNPIHPIHGTSYAIKGLPILTRLPLVPRGPYQEHLSPINYFPRPCYFPLTKVLLVLQLLTCNIHVQSTWDQNLGHCAI